MSVTQGLWSNLRVVHANLFYNIDAAGLNTTENALHFNTYKCYGHMLTLHAHTNVPLASARLLTSYPHTLRHTKSIALGLIHNREKKLGMQRSCSFRPLNLFGRKLECELVLHNE